MTQEETLQYNKRCAEFLGWDYNKLMDRWNEDMLHQYCFVESIELKFHWDWNWIMEVVEAIKEKTKFKTIDECSEDEWYATIGVTRLTITSKKEAVVKAINQFLIWYEQNKTT